METGGRMAGIETAKKLVEQQEGPQAADKYDEFSSSMNQATTFHITLKQTATKGSEDVGSIRGYAYDRNLERFEETGELLDPGQLAETRVALAEEVLAPYQLDTPVKQDAFSDFTDKHSHATFQHIKTRLQEIVSDESTSSEMLEMAALELDALDTIGINRGDVEAHVVQWQQFWQENGYDYFADQPTLHKMPNNLGVVTGYQEGINNSKEWAENAAQGLGDMIEKAAENGVLKAFRDDMIERAPNADIMGQDSSKLDKQDYREAFDQVGKKTLGEHSYNKAIKPDNNQHSNAQPSAETDIMPG